MTFILPGMGATSAMYTGPWRKLTNTCFADWPAYRNEQTLADLALRMIAHYGITRSDCVAGSSLGGMVALEIAAVLGIERVLLIGSAMHPGELTPLARRLMPLANRTVVRSSQVLARLSPLRFHKMYAAADCGFIVSMSKAILNWQGFRGDPATVSRVHGRFDVLIACPCNGDIIAGGGHLIAISHARQCAEWLARRAAL